jgi:GT2 family glycosyltransferase
MREKIYILLPVHNRREVTEHLIRCLKSQTYRDYHLVLIDDGSTDGTEEMVRSHIEDLTVIRGKGDWWWAGSLEQGYRWLCTRSCNPEDVVLIINDDTRVESDFLERGLKILDQNRRTLLLAECYSQTTDKLLSKGVHVDWRKLTFEPAQHPKEINCLSTMGLFLRVGDFLEIGGFYPRLLPHFTSDYEFTIRAYRKGFKLMTDPSLRLRLDEKTTWNTRFIDEPLPVYLRKLFTKKSAVNPVVWTFFIALACPWRWKFLNWYRAWAGNALFVIVRVAQRIRNGKQ